MLEKKERGNTANIGIIDIKKIEEIGAYLANLEKAGKVFGIAISETVIAAATLQNIAIPDRVAGHDNSRGKNEAPMKLGGGKSGDDHEANQAQGWKNFCNRVDQGTEQKNAANALCKNAKAYNDSIKALNESYLSETSLSAKGNNLARSRRHSHATEERIAQEKEDLRIEKGINKKDGYEEKMATERSLSPEECKGKWRENMQRMLDEICRNHDKDKKTHISKNR